MKIGLYLLPLLGDTTYLDCVGRGADERGIDSIWIPEPHLLAFDAYSSPFPYSPDGKLPEDYGTEGELDGFLAAAYLAAITSQIRVGIGVCVVPQRNPVYTAKDVTTLDHLLSGRFDLGVGIGWLGDEFEAVGVPFADRAARCSAHVEVMRSLWCDERAQYEGPFFSLPPSRQDPRPIQRPHPPIHVGGNSRRALKRVAEFGQGWLPWDLRPEKVKTGLSDMDGYLRARGRTRDEVSVTVAVDMMPADIDVPAYVDAGVDQLVVVAPPMKSPADIERVLDAFVEAVVEPAHNR